MYPSQKLKKKISFSHDDTRIVGRVVRTSTIFPRLIPHNIFNYTALIVFLIIYVLVGRPNPNDDEEGK